MGKETGASMRPSSYVAGGGLLDNVDVTWKKVRFEMFDYGGKVQATPCLKVDMELEDGSEVEQYFSAGSAADWNPSKDGTKLVAVGNAKGINENSNMAILVNSLIEAGFPEDKLDDDCTVFEGMNTHVIRVKAPERKGLSNTNTRSDGRTFDRMNLVVDTINKFPWDKKTTKAAGGSGGGTAKKEEAGDDVEERATEVVREVLGEATGPMDKKTLSTKVFNAMKGDPLRNKVSQLAFNEDFLSNGPWTYNGKTITL